MTRTARLTRAQAHRLIETYGFRGPREPALTRLMGAELYIFDTPARSSSMLLGSRPYMGREGMIARIFVLLLRKGRSALTWPAERRLLEAAQRTLQVLDRLLDCRTR